MKNVEFKLKESPKPRGWGGFKDALRPVLVRSLKHTDEYAVMIGVYKGFGDASLAYMFLKEGLTPMWCTNLEDYEPIRWLTKDESVTICGRGE